MMFYTDWSSHFRRGALQHFAILRRFMLPEYENADVNKCVPIKSVYSMAKYVEVLRGSVS